MNAFLFDHIPNMLILFPLIVIAYRVIKEN